MSQITLLLIALSCVLAKDAFGMPSDVATNDLQNSADSEQELQSSAKELPEEETFNGEMPMQFPFDEETAYFAKPNGDLVPLSRQEKFTNAAKYAAGEDGNQRRSKRSVVLSRSKRSFLCDVLCGGHGRCATASNNNYSTTCGGRGKVCVCG